MTSRMRETPSGKNQMDVINRNNSQEHLGIPAISLLYYRVMSTSWETSIDFVLVVLKLLAVFFLVRLILIFFGIRFEVPFIDQFLWGVVQFIFENSPHIPGFN
jgi:hypothetical protein